MVVIPIFTMPAIWLCVTFFLSLVQGRYVSSPYDLNNLKRDNVGSFAIGATRNVNVQRSGPRAKARALAKYGSGEAMAIASEKGLIGDVVAYNQSEDREWLSPVTLGTPGQEVLLDFDTGSSDLWVFSSETRTRGATNGSRKIWYPEHSSTATRVNGSRWQIMYGDGSYASGSVWRDNLAMGGITVPNTYIESATSVSRSMVTDLTLSGLLGLAFAQPSEIEPAAPTLLDTLTPLLDAPLFTVDLHWHSNGVYEFGKIDSTKYTGEMMYTPLVNNSKYWELAFTGFNVGPSLYWLESEWKAIVDTGTTLMLLQDDLVELYYKNASSVGATYNATLDAYIFPCNATLPDLHIGFDNSYIASIPGKYLNYTDLQELSDFQNCYGGLQAVGSLPFSILGDVFLKSMYTVFDIGGARVGMADKVLNAKD